MLNFEGIVTAENPLQPHPSEGLGHAWGTRGRRPQAGQQSILLALPRFSRACVSFYIIPFTSLSRFPAPLPAVFVRPLLVSRSWVVCYRSSLPAAAGNEDAGKEKRRNSKYMKMATSSTTTKRPEGVPIGRAARSDRSRAERPRSLHPASGCWGVSRSVLYDPLRRCLLL
jgi:hypothetical protein